MSQQIQQLFLTYDPVNDRLLLRISTPDHAEYLAWITRRCTGFLWEALMRILQSDVTVQSQPDQERKEAVLAFQNEEAVAKTKFSKQYQAQQVQTRPMGNTPLLIAKVGLKVIDDQRSQLRLLSPRGASVDIVFERKLAHSFSKLLADTVRKTDWGLDLKIVEPTVAAGEQEQRLN